MRSVTLHFISQIVKIFIGINCHYIDSTSQSISSKLWRNNTFVYFYTVYELKWNVIYGKVPIRSV